MHHHTHGDESCDRGTRGHHADFSRGGFKGPFGGMPPFGGFGPHGSRARRGDVRAAVLRLLSEQPMHGYQIIQELSTRSEGAWSPSAGSVYPTLQLLADEGLIVSEETAGKKVFTLTEAGTAAVAESADQPAPWDDAAQTGAHNSEFRSAMGKFMAAALQVGRGGTKAQTDAAIVIIDEARKKIYAILAED